MWFSWHVALRLLRENRSQTLLIISGVAIGVAAIVFVTALLGGLQRNIIDRTLGSQAHIRVSAPDEAARPLRQTEQAVKITRVDQRAQRLNSIEQWQAVEAALLRIPEINAISLMVTGPALARRGEATRSVAVLGVDLERYNQIVGLRAALVEGRFALAGNDVLIGSELARVLGIGLGDRLRLDADAAGGDIYTVAGIFTLGQRDIDQRFVYMGIKPAQALLNLPGGISAIDLKLNDFFQAEAIAQRLKRTLALKAESWMAVNANVLQAIAAQRATSLIIRVFVGISAAFGIASVLAVSVVQRARVIGILRAMGARRRQILLAFLMQGGVVGLLGSLLGCAIGMLLVAGYMAAGFNQSRVGLFAISVSPELIIGAALMATLVGVLAAAAPARRAARLDPIEAMRSV